MSKRLRRAGNWLGVLLLSGVAYAAAPPLASFTFTPEHPSTNDRVTFDAGTSSAQALPLRYEWDFDGDGLVDLSTLEPQARHFFDESGTYEVTLQVSDSAGEQASFARTVAVALAPVTARRTFETALGANRVLAGGSLVVTVTVRVNRELSGLGLAERFPRAGGRARWRTARPCSSAAAMSCNGCGLNRSCPGRR